MSGAKKKFLGLLGLFIVAAVTTLAVFWPQQGVSATGSVTDTISITVRGEKTRVTITSPKNEERLKSPIVTFAVNHDEISGGKVLVERISGGSGSKSYTFSSDYTLKDSKFEDENLEELFSENFGYGTYRMTATGDAYGVSPATSDAITFTYNALNPEVTVDPDTNNPVIDPAVDPNNKHVDHTHVTITPTGGEGQDPDEDTPPFFENDVQNGENWLAPFAENCPKAGWYAIVMEAVDADGNLVGQEETTWYYWAAGDLCGLPVANTGAAAPNTGGLFNGQNIAREDALITGAIVFAVAAGLGMFLVAKKSRR